MLQYRKTKDGEWVAFGPVAELRPGTITVTKKSGETKRETVVRVGKSFNVDGIACAYGYLRPNTDTRRPFGRKRACVSGGNCSSFGSGKSCGAEDCDGY